MKIIRLILSGACFLLASLAVIPAHAGSSDFAGPYIGVQGSVNAGLLGGRYHENADGSVTEGTGGAGFPAAGGAIGFNIPLGHVFFVGIEGSLDPGGGLISESDDAFDRSDTRASVSNRETWSITPGISLSEGSAIYFRLGDTEMDLRCTVGTTCPAGISGDTYGIGTIAKFGESGLYIKTEAGVTDFGDIEITNVGKQDNSTLTADPNIVYGSIQLGWQF